MVHDSTPPADLGLAAGDRVELVVTSDAFTRLRPGDRGTVRSVTQLPSDPPEPQVWVAWDTGSSLAILPAAGDQLHKLASSHNPADPV